jgi:OOP family OmpA-OmpF porin
LARFGYTATTLPAGTKTGYIRLRGWNLDAVGILPINESFSAFARGGANYAEARDDYSATGFVVAPIDFRPSQNAYNLKAGLGLQYNFNESVGLRGEYERYRINDAVGNRGDIDMLSIGLVVALGESPAKSEPIQQPVVVVAVIEPTPEPVIAESISPEVVMVIVPVLVKTQKYCSILDLQFDIKQGDIELADKEKLRVLGIFMTKYPETTGIIEGHSDDIGTAAFNQKLSQQRAESVVSYLRETFHIADNRLQAIGYGKSRPIASNSIRAGQQANRRINAVIACATDIEGLQVAEARLTMAMEIEFDPFKSDIAPANFGELAKVAQFMKANPTVLATVVGHANRAVGFGTEKVRVTPALAMEISEQRAQNVVNYLVEQQGVARSRFTTSALGQSNRVSYGTTLDGQQVNRRVNIIFNYPQ